MIIGKVVDELCRDDVGSDGIGEGTRDGRRRVRRAVEVTAFVCGTMKAQGASDGRCKRKVQVPRVSFPARVRGAVHLEGGRGKSRRSARHIRKE